MSIPALPDKLKGWAMRLIPVSCVAVVVCSFIVWTTSFVNAADVENEAALRQRLERVEILRRQRPGDGLLVYYEALTRIGLGERGVPIRLLRTLKGRKLGLIPARDIGFEPIWDEAEFQKVRKDLVDEDAETPESPVAFRLQDPTLIPEGIAFDQKTKRFFIGSVAKHKIVMTDQKGGARDFSIPSDELDAVLGLTVDWERDHLYAVSTNGPEASAKTQRRNAVVCYDITNNRLLDRFNAPEAMQLNDLVIGHDGTLYVTDSMGGALFRKKPNEKELTRFGANGALPGANGIDFSASGTLYVAISTGIARVDLSTGAATRLEQPDSVVTGGIDGLYWYDNDLVGIQNATNPGRVIRVSLTDNGAKISSLTVLQSYQHPEFDEPTTGAIANGALHVIANSYVGHYQPDGTLLNPAKLKGTVIVAVPLKR